MKTYKNEFTSFTLEVGKCYKIEDEFSIANYRIKQLGKNIIKAEILDNKVYKNAGGIVEIEVCMVEKITEIKN